MTTEIIHPKNEAHWLELRMQDITSTDISALYGCSPYSTEYELWHRKRDGKVLDFPENERMKWGTRLEESIAGGIANDNHFRVRPMKEYIRDPSLRIGSSFDYEITGSVHNTVMMEPGLLEIKNVDSLVFLKTWVEDENGHIEAPPHIEFQVQHQLAVSGRGYAYLGALVGGNRVVMLRRERNEDVIKSIKKKVTEFWESIRENNEPKPDLEKDAAFISKLYSFAEPGKVLELDEDAEMSDMARWYKTFGDKEKEAKKRKDAVKAYTRKAFRNFKISWKGKKK